MKDIEQYLSELSIRGQDFLTTTLDQPMSYYPSRNIQVDELEQSEQIQEVPEEQPEESSVGAIQELNEESMKEFMERPVRQESIQPEDLFVVEIGPFSEMDMLIPPDDLISLQPPVQTEETNEIGDVRKSLQTLCSAVSEVIDMRVLRNLYRDEYEEGMHGLMTLKQWLMNENGLLDRDELHRSFGEIYGWLLDIMEVMVKGRMNDETVDETLLASILNVLLLPFLTQCVDKQVLTRLSSYDMDRLVNLCVHGMLHDRLVTSPSQDAKRHEGYQRILSSLCSTWDVAQLVETILQQSADIEGQDYDGKVQLVFARMLARLRENRVKTLRAGDINKSWRES